MGVSPALRPRKGRGRRPGVSLTTIDGRPSCPAGGRPHVRAFYCPRHHQPHQDHHRQNLPGGSPNESDDWVPPITLGAGTAPTCDVAMAKHREAAASVSPRYGRTPKRPRYGKSPSPCRAPFRRRRGEITRPPALGLSKKHASLRFNLPPWSSRYLSKSSTWGDVDGFRPNTLPARFKTQTRAIFLPRIKPCDPESASSRSSYTSPPHVWGI